MTSKAYNGINAKEIKALAAELQPEVLRVRRHLHRRPELSFEEFETARFLQEELRKEGIPFDSGIGGTGLRAFIRGGKNSRPDPETAADVDTSTAANEKIVALRADMDALPIYEKTNLPFSSEKPGVMHACGHDAHMSVVLNAGKLLNRLRDRFSGTVMIFFQPAEEKVPGGAQAMLKDGLFSKGRPAAILGEHINPGIGAGIVGFRPGLMMASADDILVTILGKGGHGASPHLTVDPVSVSAQVISGLQQLVSRQANPAIPSVLTFGKIIGDGATNIIPDKVYLEGTFRTVDETWRAEALEKIPTLIRGIAGAFGAKAEVEIQKGYPVVDNDPDLCRRLKDAAAEFVGQDRVVDLPLVMWAEDFAYYGKTAPSCFYNLGVATEDKTTIRPLHSPELMIDEDSLQAGVGLMAWLALSELSHDPLLST